MLVLVIFDIVITLVFVLTKLSTFKFPTLTPDSLSIHVSSILDTSSFLIGSSLNVPNVHTGPVVSTWVTSMLPDTISFVSLLNHT